MLKFEQGAAGWLRRFRRDERGGLAVEFVILFPALMLIYLAMVVFWQAFLTQAVTVRATETVADMMSRETSPFDAAYLGGMHEVFDWLTSADAPTQMRLSVVSTRVDPQGVEAFQVLWSRATHASVEELAAEDLALRVPTPSVGEQLIVVETFYDYAPFFDIGITAFRMHHLVATRPRYIPQVLWRGA